nr:hypothetical protein [Azohydromonas australica]
MLRYAHQQLAPYKRVRRIDFLTELPKTISGKLRHVEQRRLEADRRERGVREAGEFFEEDCPGLKSGG